MFIYCLDKDLKNILQKYGFKLLNEYDDKAVFLFDKNIQFDFDKVDKNKILITNKMFF